MSLLLEAFFSLYNKNIYMIGIITIITQSTIIWILQMDILESSEFLLLQDY